jgi:regulator of RNase E activity RraA
MTDTAAFGALSPTALADVLGREQVMDIGIRPLWPDLPRIAGPAFTVRVLAQAQAKAATDEARTLDEWEAAHRAKIDALLSGGGFAG